MFKICFIPFILILNPISFQIFLILGEFSSIFCGQTYNIGYFFTMTIRTSSMFLNIENNLNAYKGLLHLKYTINIVHYKY